MKKNKNIKVIFSILFILSFGFRMIILIGQKNAIWYQIFPDRFYNGDESNDPTIESLWGVWPWEIQEEWEVSPWTSDWYKLQPWEESKWKRISLSISNTPVRRRYSRNNR